MKARHRGPRIAPGWDRETVAILVRFCEVDAMKVAWHGHYVAWCECAREAFLARRGLSYLDMERIGCPAPVARIELDYLRPARLGEVLAVACAHKPGGEPKLEFVYEIRNADGVLLCAAASLQIFTDTAGAVRLSAPPEVEHLFAAIRTRRPAP